MTRVLLGEIHELAARTALRNHDLRVLQRFLEQLTIIEIEGNKELFRALRKCYVAACEIDRQYRRVVLALDVHEESVFTGEQLPCPDAQQDDTCIIAVACKPD